MDTRFIEVCIGLVLVFALTGLLVSVVLETYVSLMGRRGDNLQLALRSMLADDPNRGGIAGLLSRTKTPSDFTAALLTHPLLVSQAQGVRGEARNPSYLPGDLVVSALLQQLSTSHFDGARPETPALLVNALAHPSANAKGPQPPADLVHSLQTLLQGTESDWQAFERRLVAWFDNVAERSGGWFKRWTQVRLFMVGLLAAVTFNINPLILVERLWDEEPLRRAMVAAAESANVARSAASSASAPAGQAELLGGQAAFNAPSAGSRTDRTALAARQSAQAFEVDSAITALDAAVGALIDNPRPSDLNDGGARRLEELHRKHVEAKELIRLRRASLADHDVPTRLLDLSKLIDDRLTAIVGLLSGSRLEPVRKLAEKAQDVVQSEKAAMLLQALPDAQATRCRQASSEEARLLCEKLEGLRSIGDGGPPVGWAWYNIPGCRAGECGGATTAARMTPEQAAQGLRAALIERPASDERVLAAWKLAEKGLKPPASGMSEVIAGCTTGGASCNWIMMGAGWLIVAFSAMLGAPFWFDLLGRLISLRGSGAKPAEDSKPSTAAAGGGPEKGPGSGLLAPAAPSGGGGTQGSSSGLSKAESELSAEQIRQIQQNGLQMPAAQVSGRLDSDTRIRIAAFQKAQGLLPDDGVLTAVQIERLLRGTAPAAPTTAPAAPQARGATPVRTDGSIAPLTEQEIRDIYGDIETRPVTGQKGLVTVHSTGKPGAQQLVLKRFVHPALATIAPQGFDVHELALPHFQAVFGEIVANQLESCLVSFGGCAVARHIGRDPDKRLSSHTWGIAIDLNETVNPLGATPPPAGAPGSVIALVPLFNKHGFAWGGHFKNSAPDGMHFELALRKP